MSIYSKISCDSYAFWSNHAYVSSEYRENASDKLITMIEKLFENFSGNESLIVDKDFEIYKECIEKGKNFSGNKALMVDKGFEIYKECIEKRKNFEVIIYVV